MTLKIFVFLLGLSSILNFNEACAAAASADEVRLFDRLSFRTERTFVRPLQASDLAHAKALDDSDHSYVHVTDGVEEFFYQKR